MKARPVGSCAAGTSSHGIPGKQGVAGPPQTDPDGQNCFLFPGLLHPEVSMHPMEPDPEYPRGQGPHTPEPSGPSVQVDSAEQPPFRSLQADGGVQPSAPEPRSGGGQEPARQRDAMARLGRARLIAAALSWALQRGHGLTPQ